MTKNVDQQSLMYYGPEENELRALRFSISLKRLKYQNKTLVVTNTVNTIVTYETVLLAQNKIIFNNVIRKQNSDL